jgi:hypothetical protein
MNYYDPEISFKARQPGDAEHKDEYMGLIIDGPFMNFNLFNSIVDNRPFVMIFGRETKIQMEQLALICDKTMANVQHIQCPYCEAQFPIMDDEPWGTCPDCESDVQNPNFQQLEGNPEYEEM